MDTFVCFLLQPENMDG